MELKKIIHSNQGRIIISVILGLGLATLFKRVCKGKKCVIFEKAPDDEIDDKVFKYGSKCYKFKMENSTCENDKKSNQKKTIKIAS
tara:strand:+ start:1105 stop:1362 length:258 start_codon:yes stop_codon:yes gene_type:complete